MSSDIKPLSDDDCVTHFDSRAANWSALYDRASFRDRLSQFVTRVTDNVAAGSHVLDYGCGTGILARALNEAGYNVRGVDAAEMMIEEARNTASDSTSHSLNFSHIDSNVWPDTDETFDAIVCSSVLEYIEDHHLMLQKLSSRLNPGGSLIISVPNSQSLVGRLEDVYSRLSSGLKNRRERDVEFCNKRYSAAEFGTLLNEVGIEMTDVGYFELPVVGRLGIRPSRSKWTGVMMIATGTRSGQTG